MTRVFLTIDTGYSSRVYTGRARAILGISHGTSHCPAQPDGAGRISLGPEVHDPVAHMGAVELPVGSIGRLGGGRCHAQITAPKMTGCTPSCATRAARRLPISRGP